MQKRLLRHKVRVAHVRAVFETYSIRCKDENNDRHNRKEVFLNEIVGRG